MKEILGNITFWIGLSLGLLTILDFLLRDKQKKWMTNKAELLWLWLDEQKAGKFINSLLQKKVQKGLVIFSHLSLLYIISGFLISIYFHVNTNTEFQLGQPRVYKFQVWVDAAATVFSMFIVSKYFHPLILRKLNITTVLGYLGKTFLTLFILMLLAGIIVFVVESPIIDPTMDFNTVKEYENYFGGKANIILLHIITSFLSAPMITELFIFLLMSFLGLYWIIIVYVVIVIFKILQFILIRIAENPKGPVIALSGLLTGIGAVVKVFLT